MNRIRSILLVEDNDDDVVLTMRAFERASVASDLAVVRDGQEALDYLFACGAYDHRSGAPLPDLVLLDLKLPKVDGTEVLRRIRDDKRTRRIPVVILTSSVEDRDLCATYEIGANSFVRKPVDYNEFVEAVRQLGLYWLVLNQPPPAHDCGGE